MKAKIGQPSVKPDSQATNSTHIEVEQRTIHLDTLNKINFPKGR